MTEYRPASSGHDVALLHVLFVPAFDTPANGDVGVATPSSGTAADYVLDYTYFGPPPNDTVHAQPLRVRNNKTVEVAARPFDLTAGNVFVARVAANGGVDLSQLHITRADRDVAADAVLSDIKASFRNDPRIQSLKPHG